ncbi:hypothetical protein BBD40_22650 [Paenibacillus ihbetae]|uniref:Uncharacterized protein n=1 Tax=Paenibacillus ihbetae TaxID=1870820 RepID=A0ABX3JPT5_9BACL|nr:hypothetical protein BBD40_22650 [Paenibacillus ihbetae]
MSNVNKNKRGIGIAAIAIILIGLGIFFSYDYFNPEKNWTMPEPNIDVQTKTIDGMTIVLRNAAYRDDEVTIGFELQGGGPEENDLGYRFYSNGQLLADTESGEQHKLGENHYYLTAKARGVQGQPEPLQLRVHILAKSNIEAQDILFNFDLALPSGS